MYRIVQHKKSEERLWGYMTPEGVRLGKFKDRLLQLTSYQNFSKIRTALIHYTVDDIGIITMTLWKGNGDTHEYRKFTVEPCDPEFRVNDLVLPENVAIPTFPPVPVEKTPEEKPQKVEKLSKREAYLAQRKQRKVDDYERFSKKYSYSEISTKLREGLRHANMDFAIRFSKSSSSIYVIAQKKGKVWNIRVADHDGSKSHYSDLFFTPEQIISGEFEKSIKSLSN